MGEYSIENPTYDNPLFVEQAGDRTVDKEIYGLLEGAVDSQIELPSDREGFTSHAEIEVIEDDGEKTVTIYFWDHDESGLDAEMNKDHAIGDDVNPSDFQHRRAELTFGNPEGVWMVRKNVHNYALELAGVKPDDLTMHEKNKALIEVGDKYMEQAIQLLAKQQDDE